MERDVRRAVVPRLTMMGRMSNEGGRRRPRHGPAHTGRGDVSGEPSKTGETSSAPLTHPDQRLFYKEEENREKGKDEVRMDRGKERGAPPPPRGDGW